MTKPKIAIVTPLSGVDTNKAHRLIPTEHGKVADLTAGAYLAVFGSEVNDKRLDNALRAFMTEVKASITLPKPANDDTQTVIAALYVRSMLSSLLVEAFSPDPVHALALLAAWDEVQGLLVEEEMSEEGYMRLNEFLDGAASEAFDTVMTTVRDGCACGQCYQGADEPTDAEADAIVDRLLQALPPELVELMGLRPKGETFEAVTDDEETVKVAGDPLIEPYNEIVAAIAARRNLDTAAKNMIWAQMEANRDTILKGNSIGVLNIKLPKE